LSGGFGAATVDSRRSFQNKRQRAVATIYKICPASAWREAERLGAYRGSADDARDGFIHFSTAAQVPGTLAKYYSGQSNLLLIAVDAMRSAMPCAGSRRAAATCFHISTP
jgi:hypothetical protein